MWLFYELYKTYEVIPENYCLQWANHVFGSFIRFLRLRSFKFVYSNELNKSFLWLYLKKGTLHSNIIAVTSFIRFLRFFSIWWVKEKRKCLGNVDHKTRFIVFLRYVLWQMCDEQCLWYVKFSRNLTVNLLTQFCC